MLTDNQARIARKKGLLLSATCWCDARRIKSRRPSGRRLYARWRSKRHGQRRAVSGSASNDVSFSATSRAGRRSRRPGGDPG